MPTRAELIWDGKYDAKGNRVAPLRAALPFQTVETINESAQQRARSLFQQLDQDQPWRNRLVWGDKKYVLPSLLPEFAGQVNLIYIDPPFDTGADFSFTATIPDSDPEDDEDDSASFTKEPSLIEQKAYRDTWGRGIDSYLQWFYETIVLLHELLAEDGSIYIHLDVHRGPLVKIVTDEVFGPENFQNEIAWYYYNKLHGASKRCFPKAFDQILYYVKNKQAPYRFKTLTEPRDKPIKKLKYRFIKGKIQNIKDETGKTVTYLSTERQIDNVWRIRCLQPANKEEWVGYDTQKPVNLIERILEASSEEGDLVLDCFCGSGSSLVAAERMNRRWIGSDLSRFAIHTTRKRLLQTEGVRPFIVQNLGKYERQLWQTGQFAKDGPESPEQADQRHRAYIAFILKLYGAAPINGRTWLHGARAGRMVHVGGVEAPVSLGDVKQIVAEFKKAMGTGKDAPSTNGIDVLGWDFAFEINEVARQQAADANIKMSFKRIPRDVMDKRAVDQGEIKFFELAALGVDVKTNGKSGAKPSPSKRRRDDKPPLPTAGEGGERSEPGEGAAAPTRHSVTLTLSDFIIPPDDVPQDVREAVKHWSQWIDYWSVDWDNKSDTFHNQWQAFRTRKDKKLPLEVTHEYPEPGVYRIVVKVIDILGNDTTKTVKVTVK